MPARLQTLREQEEFERFVQALFTGATARDILTSLSDLDVPLPYRARLKVVYSPQSPSEVLLHLSKRGQVHALGSEGGPSYYLEDAVGRRERERIKVSFAVVPFDSTETTERVQALVAVCSAAQWLVLRRFARGAYPDLVPILLSQADLIRGAQQLRTVTGHEVRVRSLSAKESIEGRERERRSVREWTDEDLGQALVNIQDRRQILTSLEVDFFPKLGGQRHVMPKASCRIRKTGEVEVSGSFSLAFKSVAAQIAAAGEKKLRFLAGRGMRDARYVPRALAVNFKSPVFEDREASRALVAALARYPRSMHAVEHGNPYAHLKVTDLFDGSSFDIWALPPDRLALIPGLRATEAAFERIVHYVFDAFKEGDLAGYGRGQESVSGGSE